MNPEPHTESLDPRRDVSASFAAWLASCVRDPRMEQLLRAKGDNSPQDSLQEAALYLWSKHLQGETPAHLAPGFFALSARWQLSAFRRSENRRKRAERRRLEREETERSWAGGNYQPMEPSEGPLGGRDFDREHLLQKFRQDLSQLCPQLVEMLFAYADGRSWKDIAERWELTPEAAKRRCYRAMKRLRRANPEIESAFAMGAATASYGNGSPSGVWIDAAGAEHALEVSAGELCLVEGSLSGYLRLRAKEELRARLARGFAWGLARDPESGLLVPLAPFVPRFEYESARDAELKVLLPLGLEGRATKLPANNLHLAFLEPAAA